MVFSLKGPKVELCTGRNIMYHFSVSTPSGLFPKFRQAPLSFLCGVSPGCMRERGVNYIRDWLNRGAVSCGLLPSINWNFPSLEKRGNFLVFFFQTPFYADKRSEGSNELMGNWWQVHHVCTIQHGGFRVCEGSKSVCSSSGTIFHRRWLRKAFRRC